MFIPIINKGLLGNGAKDGRLPPLYKIPPSTTLYSTKAPNFSLLDSKQIFIILFSYS